MSIIIQVHKKIELFCKRFANILFGNIYYGLQDGIAHSHPALNKSSLVASFVAPATPPFLTSRTLAG